MKVLVVEDQKPAAEFVRKGLSEEAFAVDVAATGPDADLAVAVNQYDAIVLDVNLPGRDGFSLCDSWRRNGLVTPILFLTARDDVRDRVQGLNAGGDDYLVKPFAFEELLARVRALIRRGQGATRSPILQAQDVEIDTATRRVTRAGRTVPLTAREYQLLEYLMYQAGKLVTRTDLWEHVWSSGSEPDSNVIDVYIRYLRDKLGRDCNLIETVRGMGYILHA